MSKEFFRFLRGEINGFYLTSFYNTLNRLSTEDKTFLRNLYNTVFKSADEVTGIERPMSSDDITGIGVFAGVFMPRVTVDSYNGSIRLSMSNIVDGEEYSERGLWNIEQEKFGFFHTSDPQTTDINALATDENKSSLVGENDTLLGYIPSGEQILKEDGTIDLTKILSSPPSDVPYTEFYGTKFLYLSEGDEVKVQLNLSMFFNLIKALQWIRYNGASVDSLCKIFNILCPDFIKIDNISWNGEPFGEVDYVVDETMEIEQKQVRIAILKYFMKKKFPQYVLVEV